MDYANSWLGTLAAFTRPLVKCAWYSHNLMTDVNPSFRTSIFKLYEMKVTNILCARSVSPMYCRVCCLMSLLSISEHSQMAYSPLWQKKISPRTSWWDERKVARVRTPTNYPKLWNMNFSFWSEALPSCVWKMLRLSKTFRNAQVSLEKSLKITTLDLKPRGELAPYFL